jgi:hypothetical protein
MTAQMGERLCYEGREVVMCSEPLGDYFKLAGIEPEFRAECTGLWRGYVGTWDIQDGHLYLIALNGRLKDGTEANVATLFPDSPERVLAYWYSGKLRVPQGKLLRYIHGGYGSTYEDDLFITIEKGVVAQTVVQHNGAAEDSDDAEGYQVGAMYFFGHRHDSDKAD